MTARRFAIGCGTGLVLLLLVAGCGIASLYSQLPAGEHPAVDFESEDITAARARAIPALEAELDAVARR